MISEVFEIGRLDDNKKQPSSVNRRRATLWTIGRVGQQFLTIKLLINISIKKVASDLIGKVIQVVQMSNPLGD